MHVVHDSWDALILKERALILRAIGVVLTGGGIAMVGGAMRASAPVTALWITGTIMGALGALMVLLPAAHTFAFSLSERRLVVVRRRIGNTDREEYSLRDVGNAFVEESKSDDSGNTWRVVVELTDGRKIPVTTYYTSGYENKRRAAERMRAFLERAGNRATFAPRPASEHLTADLSQARRRQYHGALALFSLFGLLFGGIGAVNMVREHQRLTTWIPVEATILSKRVDVNSDSDGNTYSPVVVYRYYVNDRPYTSSRVLPLRESRSGGWAHRIVADYDVNARYTAWYDPTNPTEAFLRRSRSLVAMIFTGIGMLIILGVFFAARRIARQRTV